FVRHRDGFVVHVPTVPLGRLYGEELRDWFTRHGVTVRSNAAARSVVVKEPNPPAPFPKREGGEDSCPPPRFGEGRGEGFQVSHLLLRDGSTLSADWYVLAVPFDRVADLL